MIDTMRSGGDQIRSGGDGDGRSSSVRGREDDVWTRLGEEAGQRQDSRLQCSSRDVTGSAAGAATGVRRSGGRSSEVGVRCTGSSGNGELEDATEMTEMKELRVAAD